MKEVEKQNDEEEKEEEEGEEEEEEENVEVEEVATKVWHLDAIIGTDGGEKGRVTNFAKIAGKCRGNKGSERDSDRE